MLWRDAHGRFLPVFWGEGERACLAAVTGQGPGLSQSHSWSPVHDACAWHASFWMKPLAFALAHPKYVNRPEQTGVGEIDVQ